MKNRNSMYVNGQLYDLVLWNNIVYHSFSYDAMSRAFFKGEDKVDPRDVTMFREV